MTRTQSNKRIETLDKMILLTTDKRTIAILDLERRYLIIESIKVKKNRQDNSM